MGIDPEWEGKKISASRNFVAFEGSKQGGAMTVQLLQHTHVITIRESDEVKALIETLQNVPGRSLFGGVTYYPSGIWELKFHEQLNEDGELIR